jgi:NAD(P)-dependent dehydrogenase (short-subunit alcohol dehydrogenase family)
MEKNWNTQTIAITGAASGLGKSISSHFARLGAKVLGLDRNEQDLSKLQEEFPRQFHPVICDVTDWSAVERVFSGHPVVDVLVNSAGITGKTNIKSYETDPANVDQVFRVNFFGSYYTSKAVLPGMAARGYGRVLHIASIAGKEGNAGMLAYSASKAAVIGMAKVQGKEMAGTGVTVNALAPAVIQTPLVDAMPEEQVKYMTSKIPMQRCAQLEELVAIVDFAVSPACSFTTGFTFDLSGGRATY